MADQEDLFYVPEGSPTRVYQRPVKSADGRSSTMGFMVCECDEFVDGAAEQIARALNRLPKAEALLVEVASRLREMGGSKPGAPKFGVDALADKIEEFVCG